MRQLHPKADQLICPLMTNGWAAPVPSQSKSILIGGAQHNEMPVVNGIALVPCQGDKCKLWDNENSDCRLNGITALLEILAFGEDDEDDGADSGEESQPDGGNNGSPEKEPVPVNQDPE